MTPLKQNNHRYLSFTDNSAYRRFIQNEQSNVIQTEGLTKEPPTQALTHGTYGGLLFHPKWKEKRKEILAKDHHLCVICKSDKELQVHHRQYHFIVSQNQFRFPWDYADHLLITLCESCHSRGHNKYKVPTINV
jgi:hypothetical protein